MFSRFLSNPDHPDALSRQAQRACRTLDGFSSLVYNLRCDAFHDGWHKHDIRLSETTRIRVLVDARNRTLSFVLKTTEGGGLTLSLNFDEVPRGFEYGLDLGTVHIIPHPSDARHPQRPHARLEPFFAHMRALIAIDERRRTPQPQPSVASRTPASTATPPRGGLRLVVNNT